MRPDSDSLNNAIQAIWVPNIVPFLLGSLVTFIGMASLVTWVLRRKAREHYFIYMGVFILLFGVRILAGNELTRVSGVFSPRGLLWTESFISYYLTLFSILFVTCFIGWGWKRSFLWFLILHTGYSVTATVVDICMQIPYYSGIPFNNYFAIAGTLLVLANLFQSHIRMTHVIKALGAGFGIFALSILLANLAEIGLLPSAFSQKEPAFFICLCILIYVAIYNSTLTETNLKTVKRDLDTARKIQNAILPQQLPSCGHCRMAARYVPMTQVGGDFYDFHLVSQDHMGILVADVSGHGIPAALIASMVKIAFLSQLDHGLQPKELLSGMNNTLTGQLNNEFITVIYLCVDLASGEVVFSTAGHPPPIVVNREQKVARPLPPGGIPLGIRKEVTFPEGRTRFSPGDRLILYTDGLTELTNSRGELFGTDRLTQLMVESSGRPVEEAADLILRRAMEWTGRKKESGLEDDLTFILFDA